MNKSEDSKYKAKTSAKKGISAVWLLPFIACLIGLGMVYEHWKNQGIEVTIEFENAEGLEANKTRVKFRNVDIGIVKEIKFTEQGNSIQAIANINRNMQDFLQSDTQFWVVRPRVGSSGISGIGTLLSGAYIQLEPGKSEYYSQQFRGLDSPPIASPTTAGLKLTLLSAGNKSLNIGNPVIYRGFEVGAVESVNFDVESRQVSYGIFIQAPYDGLITSNTHFWNSGGFNLKADAQGVELDVASIESFLAGGIQFDVPEDLPLGNKVKESRSFELYASKSSISDARRYEYLEYIILVEDSVGGLLKGAPVEYRGIRIGRVHLPYLGFHQTNQIDPDETRIPVLIHVEPRRITRNGGYNVDWFDQQFQEWLKTGLAASLVTSSYITGNLKVSLDMSNSMSKELEYFGDYVVIPTSQSGFASILSKTDALLTKLNDLPLESLLNQTEKTLISADSLFEGGQDTLLSTQALLIAFDDTLKEAQSALKGIQADSPLYKKLQDNLEELQSNLELLEPLIRDVKQNPNILIFGDEGEADIIPDPTRNEVKE